MNYRMAQMCDGANFLTNGVVCDFDECSLPVRRINNIFILLHAPVAGSIQWHFPLLQLL